jgi:hypothetical protein
VLGAQSPLQSVLKHVLNGDLHATLARANATPALGHSQIVFSNNSLF